LTGSDLGSIAAIIACFVVGFVIVWGFVPSRVKTPRSEQPTQTAGPPTPRDGRMEWFEVLGIAETASREEIADAYHRQISLYHPDKVSQLGPEMRAAAEAKAREINAAFAAANRLQRT
jgi:DnaJ-domain-containing protein 1